MFRKTTISLFFYVQYNAQFISCYNQQISNYYNSGECRTRVGNFSRSTDKPQNVEQRRDVKPLNVIRESPVYFSSL